MSKTVERAIQAVEDSKFVFKDQNTLEILDAFIFWTNFKGEANKFGNKARTFNLAVNEEVANILQENGWRVRPIQDGEGTTLYFVNIKVNMNSPYPPLVTLFSEFRGRRTRRSLDVENVGELDRIDIQSADCVINAYESKMYPGKVTGYLKKLHIIQEPDVEFGGKYDDWLDEEDKQPDFPDED